MPSIGYSLGRRHSALFRQRHPPRCMSDLQSSKVSFFVRVTSRPVFSRTFAVCKAAQRTCALLFWMHEVMGDQEAGLSPSPRAANTHHEKTSYSSLCESALTAHRSFRVWRASHSQCAARFWCSGNFVLWKIKERDSARTFDG